MSYDFDRVIDRRGTNSLKYDCMAERGKPADVLPLWVADMDFQTPKEVIEAVRRVCDFGIYGYSRTKAPYFEAVSNWFQTQHNWRPEQEWMLKSPGVVAALASAVRAFTKPGERAIVLQPVYGPFKRVVVENGRKLVVSELLLKDGHYEIDFADFEQKIVDHEVRLFILCSPHNPIGRVWTRDELVRLGTICKAHGVVLVSDEIHCDFTYPGHPHTVFPSLGGDLAQNCVLCTAPSKTFNLAGLQTCNLFVPNPELREKLQASISSTGFNEVGLMGSTACEAAYRCGAPWLKELKAYLLENLNFVRAFLQRELPAIRLVEPEGTYLLWLDCRGLGLTPEALDTFLVEQAKLWVDDGLMFGPPGGGFQRVNIACPRATVKAALERLKKAVDTL